MALNDYKITSYSKPVSALDDTPQMSAAQLKEWFDSNSANEIKTSINGIVDEVGKALETKLDKEEGKALSSNDFTDEEKQKLEGLSNYDDAQIKHELDEKIEDAPLDGESYIRRDGEWINARLSDNNVKVFSAVTADKAGYAFSATFDEYGNDISETYALKADSLPLLTDDEVDTILPTGVYRYEDEYDLSVIIVRHTEYENRQAKIMSDGTVYYRAHPFLDGEWHIDSWYEKKPLEVEYAWQAGTAAGDMDGNPIHLTYATKDEIDNFIADAPSDDKSYARKNANWVEIKGGSGGGVEDVPNDDVLYARSNGEWVDISTHLDYVKEAPNDPNLPTCYVRRHGQWVDAGEVEVDYAVSAGSAISDDMGNYIFLTYATKAELEEVKNTLNSILAKLGE